MSEMTFDMTASIVLYNNNRELVERAIRSIINSNITFKLYLIDNSPDSRLRQLVTDSRIEYIFNNQNIGFGRGHNKALKEIIGQSKFHLVLNPDIFFDTNVLRTLLNFIESDSNVGLVMPMVYNFDSELQYLCKRLPTPMDLILRRFGGTFIKGWIRKRMEHYEMRDMNYEKTFTAPYLSGCFMLIRVEVLEKIGLFDERYFMYMEDIDLSRRISKLYKTVYYPESIVYHGHAKDSYSNIKLLGVHIKSAIKYFNKWGWIYDVERKILNDNSSYYIKNS